jgi:hypothetical protein
MDKECAVCGTTEGKLQRCGDCKNVYYCGREHQREDYKSHKLVCFKRGVGPTPVLEDPAVEEENSKVEKIKEDVRENAFSEFQETPLLLTSAPTIVLLQQP